MARRKRGDAQPAEANIWPAVTDSILLMASIFIVLAVSALVAISVKVDDKAGEGEDAGEKLICRTVTLSAQFLFDSGKSHFRDPAKARKELKARLLDLRDSLAGLRRYARQQKEWGGGHYLVLEVAGHTDLDPMSVGSREALDQNWELSGNRAVTVVHELESILYGDKALRDDFGVRLAWTSGSAQLVQAQTGDTVLRVAGYSSHVPVALYPDAPRSTVAAATKEENRRVELRLYAQPTYVLKSQPRPVKSP